MILAKKRVIKLKQKKTLLDKKQKKVIEKKFGKTKRVEKDIENYIESLFHREIQQQQKMRENLSQTPINKNRRQDQQSTSNLKKDSSQLMRQSFNSQINTFSQPAQQFYDQDPPSTGVTTTLPFLLPLNLQSETEAHEILATSDFMQDASSLNNADRQQKNLRIRKGGKQQQLNNMTSNTGNKMTYTKEMNTKLGSHINKVKSTQQSQRQHQQSTSQKQSQKNSIMPMKPKTFAENLMNMLAVQNIGQVFSENPVDALAILKDNKAESSSKGLENQKRRNSNISRVAISDSNNQSFINSSQRNNGFYPAINGPLQTNSATSTIDNSKPIQFPKLTEFKSATNNIYLAQRPVQDPRQESEFQQQILESKMKKQQQDNLNKSNNCIQSQKSGDFNYSNLNNGPEIHRKSSESLMKLSDKQQFINYQEFQNDVNYQLIQARPREQNHLMVLQAYKKSTQPQSSVTDHFKKSKKRGESQGYQQQMGGTIQNNPIKKKKYHQIYNVEHSEKLGNKNNSSNKKQQDGSIVIPPLVEQNSKLIIF